VQGVARASRSLGEFAIGVLLGFAVAAGTWVIADIIGALISCVIGVALGAWAWRTRPRARLGIFAMATVLLALGTFFGLISYSMFGFDQ
jgi:hypothetical protein